MERLEKIGFDKLVHICCAQIPRHLCGQFMDSFDPPTKNVAIRGKSFHLRPEDVKQLMGLPCGGGEIERKAKKDDKAFKSLKRSYGSVPYKMIGTWIIESTVEEQFEILFVIYALGTLLCPTASIKVSDALLKVIVATKEDFREFDWCTFVLNELCNSIGDYKSKIRKGKGTVTGNTIYIGGCMYFFMIYCLQNFPLGPLQAPTVEDAIHFWDDTKIKRRVKIERESKKGLLLPYGDEVGQSSTELQPETALTHPVRCEKNYLPFKQDSSRGRKVMSMMRYKVRMKNLVHKMKRMGKRMKMKVQSQMAKMKGKKRPKHENDKKALYQLCTTRCTEEEELEEFVEMYDYFLTRADLQCLRGRQWISDRFMSMVAKTLVGDELKTSGHVRRHIFSSN
ncbi:hypothetical protein K1719_020097 [Acacia pycnantha]|nr:hypothetical protein K1719_020097 [Acacia pycnantha]